MVRMMSHAPRNRNQTQNPRRQSLAADPQAARQPAASMKKISSSTLPTGDSPSTANCSDFAPKPTPQASQQENPPNPNGPASPPKPKTPLRAARSSPSSAPRLTNSPPPPLAMPPPVLTKLAKKLRPRSPTPRISSQSSKASACAVGSATKNTAPPTNCQPPNPGPAVCLSNSTKLPSAPLWNSR